LSFYLIIEQQFRAGKALLSKRINNELLFINLAKGPAEGILFRNLHNRAWLAAIVKRQ
jgi:hypothetical protein